MPLPLRFVVLPALFSLMAQSTTALAESSTGAPSSKDKPQENLATDFFQTYFTPDIQADFLNPTKPSPAFVELASSNTSAQQKKPSAALTSPAPEADDFVGRIDFNYINLNADELTRHMAERALIKLWMVRQDAHQTYEKATIAVNVPAQKFAHAGSDAASDVPALRILFGDSAFFSGESERITSYGCIGNKFVALNPSEKQILLIGTMLHCANPHAYQLLQQNGPQKVPETGSKSYKGSGSLTAR